MASVTQPSWKPDPVERLPFQTTVDCAVTRDSADATGLEVTYELRSPDIRFSGAAGPSDKAASTPTPTTTHRTDRVVVDQFVGNDAALRVHRALTIELTGTSQPGHATIIVTVADLGVANGNCGGSIVCRKSAVVSFDLQ
jgi:hypothetical protein